MDHRPQKEDPNRIRIAVGGNLITYKGSTSTRTADLTTSKLLWNIILSTKDAKYMCIDIKKFYLTAALDYYEYMKIPLAIFPEWIKTQYNLNTHARDGFVIFEIRRAVWGLPQAGICKARTAVLWNRGTSPRILKDCAISRTRHRKGSLRVRRSVDF